MEAHEAPAQNTFSGDLKLGAFALSFLKGVQVRERLNSVDPNIKGLENKL